MKAKLFIATAALALGIAVPAADAAGKALTNVTIDGPNGDFAGQVSSPAGDICEDNRKVVVYKLTGTTADPKADQKIGSDTSEPDGYHASWSIGNSGYKDGSFYARAKRTTDCKAGMSPVITL